MPTVASETPEPSIAHRLHASELIAALRTDERQTSWRHSRRARRDPTECDCVRWNALAQSHFERNSRKGK
jgi:hypothetical protein